MGVEIFGATQLNPDADLDCRVVEDLAGTNPWAGANTSPRQQHFGARYGTELDIFGGAGGGTLAGGFLLAGRRIWAGSSAAGVVFRRGSVAGTFTFPMSQDFSGPNGFAGAALGRRFRSYLHQVACRITAQAVGGRFETSLAESDAGIAISGTRPGPAWVSDQAINAGRWTVRYRQLNGGAISTLADSGISNVPWTTLGIKYTEGVTPRIEWIANGVIVFALAGFASMPTFPGGGLQEPGWTAMYGWAAGVGSQANMGPALNESRFL